jgi:signal transduction histidine kinase
LLGLIERFQTIRRGLGEGRPVEEAIAEAVVAEEQADLTYIRAQMPVAIDRCIDGLNRVTAIVRSLKEFAHPADREMAAIDLNHAIESTLTIATNEYKYVADLERDLGELPPVVCHVGEICQVVLNIVVNAAHAIGDVVRGSDRRGIIRVRTRSAGDTAVITISDTGGGIPEGVRARIFDPFFTTKGVGKGTGQGLAIALSTVKEKHGGELTFDTGAQGTTFFIRLPIFGKPKGESDGDPPEATGSSGARGSPVTGSIIGIRS